VEQPFTLASPARPLLVVPVQVNGKGPFPFALDTGASQTVITPALARTLGLGTADGPDILGAGGAAGAGVTILESLGVAGTVQRDRTVIISGFIETIHQEIGAHLDGILVYDFLKSFLVSIDYTRQILRLVPFSDALGTAPSGCA
jgi:hypothetical protein